MAQILTRAQRAIEDSGAPAIAHRIVGPKEKRLMIARFNVGAGYERKHGFEGIQRSEEMEIGKVTVVYIGFDGVRLGMVGNAEPRVGAAAGRRFEVVKAWTDVVYAFELDVGEWGMDKIAVGRLMEDATSVRSMFRVESVTYDSTPVVCLLAESEGGLRACVVVGPRVTGIVPGEEEGDTDKWCLDISDLFCRVWKAVKEWPTLNEEGAKTARMPSASGGGAMPRVSGG